METGRDEVDGPVQMTPVADCEDCLAVWKHRAIRGDYEDRPLVADGEDCLAVWKLRGISTFIALAHSILLQTVKTA